MWTWGLARTESNAGCTENSGITCFNIETLAFSFLVMNFFYVLELLLACLAFFKFKECAQLLFCCVLKTFITLPAHENKMTYPNQGMEP
jgi:hypothetical protein